MPRTISFLFTRKVYAAREGDPLYSFRQDVLHHYGKFFTSKNIVRYTTITAGFAVTLLGIVQVSLSKLLEDEAAQTSDRIFNLFTTITPVVSALIVAIADASTQKAEDELKRLINYGVQNGFFRSSKVSGVSNEAVVDEEKAEGQLTPEAIETSEHSIRYQMGLSKA